MLIGLVGLIGSGKDTVAERLVLEHGFKRDSFAKSH
jgi:dephospho-CoA kinase